MVFLRLRVAPEQQLLAWLSGGKVDVHHLHGRELFQNRPRSEPASDLPQLCSQGDVQAICQVGHEDMRFDPFLFLVEDGPDLQIVLEIFEKPLRLSKLRALIKRLKQLQTFKKKLTRDQLLMAVGQAKEQAGRAFNRREVRLSQLMGDPLKGP